MIFGNILALYSSKMSISKLLENDFWDHPDTWDNILILNYLFYLAWALGSNVDF